MPEDLTGRPDHEVAVEAALAGAAVLRRMYGTELEHRAKDGIDFATAADLASERAILTTISAARPSDGFVGEEYGEATCATGSRTWLVDPLCGTLNFAARTPLFSVNVALVDSDTTVAAAVSHPSSHEVYWARGDEFGILGRSTSSAAPASRIVDINADGPLDRGFVGAQLGADPEFRATFSPRVESTTLALAWVATWSASGLRHRREAPRQRALHCGHRPVPRRRMCGHRLQR